MTKDGSAWAAPAGNPELLAAIVDDAPCGVLLLDGQRQIIAANRAACALTGRSEPELRRMRLDELAATGDRDRLVREWRLIRQQGGLAGQADLLRGDGSVVAVGYTSTTSTRQGIRAVYLSPAVAASAVGLEGRQTEPRNPDFEDIARIAQLGMWRWDRRTGRASGSAETHRLLGLDPASEMPSAARLHEMLRPDALGRTRQGIEEAGPYGVWEVELELSRPDGRPYWLLQRGTADLDAAGAVIGYHGIVIDITAQKEAERALAASEAHYRLLAENAADVVFRCTADGILEWVSASVVHLLGCTARELCGRPLMELVHPADAERANAAQRMLTTGLPSRIDVRIRTKDGGWRWVAVHARPLQDEGGRPDGSVGSWRDQEAERQARDALMASEQRFRTIFEENPLGVAVIDPLTGRFREVNERFAAIVGRTRRELELTDWMSITHPDDVACQADAMDRLRADDALSAQAEKRYMRADGTIVWASLTLTRLPDEERGPQQLGMLEDITQRRAVQQELEEARAKLAEAQRIAKVGSWTRDARTGERTWTDEVYRIYGLKVGDPILGIEHPRYLSEADHEALKERIKGTLTDGTPYEFEYDVLGADGLVRHAMARGYPIRDEGGEVVGVHGTVADITDEHERREARARRVSRHADYLARVEHTLRTNLSVVEGWSEIIAEAGETIDPEVRRAALEAIGRNARALTAHLRALMTEAAQEARAETIAPVPVDVAAIAAGVVADYAGLADLRSISAMPPSDVYALGTPEALDTVVRHLVENAIRHAGRGGTVEVSVGLVPGGDNRVALVVRDDGDGLPEGVDVFAAFARSGAGDGHGLGLHVVRMLVEAVGGSVHAANREGAAGAVFTVTLAAAAPG